MCFHGIKCLCIIAKTVSKIQDSLKSVKNDGTLREDKNVIW